MNNLKRSKKANGITLIALIITIVVLLILAVVTIKAVSDGGIIQKAKDSTLEHKIAKEKEDIRLALGEWKLQSNIPGYSGTFEGVINKLLTGKGSATSNEDGSLTIIMESGRKYTVTQAGTITLLENAGGSEVVPPTTGGNDEPEVEETLGAGLYSEDGTCTASWDKLIDDGIITVTEDGALSCNNKDSIQGKLVIDDRVTSLSGWATFGGCTGLTSVIIPDSVTSIGKAFMNCTNLTSAIIGNGVTSITSSAFSGCSSLTSVTIGSGVESIDNYAFQGCISLAEINISENNSSYSSDDGVLYNKNKTTLLKVPSGKTGSYIIPDSVTSIDAGIFDGAVLTSVTIGSGVENIDDYAFQACSALTEINVSENNSNYSSDNGVLYDKNKTTLLICPQGKTGSYTISSPVTSIYSGAFAFCASLTSVTISNSVTSIGDMAFYFCEGLTSVTIEDGDNDVSIGEMAFMDCTGLTTITLPDSVTSVGADTFPSNCVVNGGETLSGYPWGGTASN